jgi:hypothetical protein
MASTIQLPGWNPPAPNIAVLGDVIDFTPSDRRFSYSYAVTSAPGGSSATFSGATFTPDVIGSYTFTVTAGAEVLTLSLFVFAASVYSALATRRIGTDIPKNVTQDLLRSDNERRSILKGIAGQYPTATLTSWNSGTWPAGLDVRLQQFGGA